LCFFFAARPCNLRAPADTPSGDALEGLLPKSGLSNPPVGVGLSPFNVSPGEKMVESLAFAVMKRHRQAKN
jgi:hypothetical protein